LPFFLEMLSSNSTTNGSFFRHKKGQDKYLTSH
jgi:hypothetical protein